MAGPTTTTACERPSSAARSRSGSSSNGTSVGVIDRIAGLPTRGRAAAREREGEERPELVGAVDADDEQQHRDHRVDGERAHVDQLSRQPVGERPGRQREEEQRQELGQADEAEVERVPGDVVDLPADGHEDHLAAEPVRRRSSRSRACSRERGGRLAGDALIGRRGYPYDADVRAVVLDADGQPRLADAPAPAEPMRVLACGLCGSDVEKIGVAPAGTVLGHEVVARRADGARVALIHHLPCGECERCLAGHESTCERLRRADDRPGRLRRGGRGRRRDRAAGRDRRRGRHLPRAARLRAPRSGARAARACARRRPGLRRPALRCGAATPWRRRLRHRRATRARRARARRPGRRRGSLRPGGAARCASRPAAPSSSSPPPHRSTSTSSTGTS